MSRLWTEIVRYKQIPQRSPEWYDIRGHYVTGSDVAALVPLTDAYLQHYLKFFNIAAFQKTKHGCKKLLKEWYASRLKAQANAGLNTTNNSGAGFSAASHGILFEDVVLNIVAQKMRVIIKPLGLIICPHNAHCAISPDGVLCFDEKPAMSLELKCVTTRNITTEYIPFDYFMQTEFAAWQLGCSHGVYCEADIMQVSELYWKEHYKSSHAIASHKQHGIHPFGLLLFHLNTSTYKIPDQFIRFPAQFLQWRDDMVKTETGAWRTIYYKINEVQLLKIPVRENFESLFAPIFKEHHDRLMSYTKDANAFARDFPTRVKTAAKEKNDDDEWLSFYIKDL